MKRMILTFYVMAAVVAALCPVMSEARLAANHNETLVSDRQ